MLRTMDTSTWPVLRLTGRAYLTQMWNWDIFLCTEGLKMAIFGSKMVQKWPEKDHFNISFHGTSTTMYAKGLCAISSKINHFCAVGAVLWRRCDYHTASFTRNFSSADLLSMKDCSSGAVRMAACFFIKLKTCWLISSWQNVQLCCL